MLAPGPGPNPIMEIEADRELLAPPRLEVDAGSAHPILRFRLGKRQHRHPPPDALESDAGLTPAEAGGPVAGCVQLASLPRAWSTSGCRRARDMRS